MASELKPLAHDWCEGFVCPLRVVGRERGVLRPDQLEELEEHQYSLLTPDPQDH